MKCKQINNLIIFYCPGCQYDHCFDVTKWTFNNDFDKPTFSPSLLCNPSYPEHRCHLFVKDGKIQYLSDCHHDLKNTTVEMVDLDDSY